MSSQNDKSRAPLEQCLSHRGAETGRHPLTAGGYRTDGLRRNIRRAEGLGAAHIGSPHDAIVPPKRRIDRAEYGRAIAALEDGTFTPKGYIVPERQEVSGYGA
jgi:hypothetical protein